MKRSRENQRNNFFITIMMMIKKSCGMEVGKGKLRFESVEIVQKEKKEGIMCSFLGASQ